MTTLDLASRLASPNLSEEGIKTSRECITKSVWYPCSVVGLCLPFRRSGCASCSCLRKAQAREPKRHRHCYHHHQHHYNKRLTNTEPILLSPSLPTVQIFEAMLWSDPRPIQGRQISARGAGVEFGQDITHEFLRTNHAALIIRSHECVREGFELLHSGRLITLFSARCVRLACLFIHSPWAPRGAPSYGSSSFSKCVLARGRRLLQLFCDGCTLPSVCPSWF